MIGNDVVDLLDADAEPGSDRAGFDARVFGEAERDEISRAMDASRMRWRLWSAKEASYKAARRLDARTRFSPVRFAVELDTEDSKRAIVRHADARFFVRFLDARDHVHAVASSTDECATTTRFETLLIGHARITSPTPARQSALVRAHASRALATHWGIDPAAIRFERVARMPRILLDGRPIATPVSFSHHGSYVAWVIAGGAAVSRHDRMRRTHVDTEGERIAS